MLNEIMLTKGRAVLVIGSNWATCLSSVLEWAPNFNLYREFLHTDSPTAKLSKTANELEQAQK